MSHLEPGKEGTPEEMSQELTSSFTVYMVLASKTNLHRPTLQDPGFYGEERGERQGDRNNSVGDMDQKCKAVRTSTVTMPGIALFLSRALSIPLVLLVRSLDVWM